MKEIHDRSKALGTTFCAIAIGCPFKSMPHGEVGEIVSVDLNTKSFILRRLENNELITGSENEIDLLEYMYKM